MSGLVIPCREEGTPMFKILLIHRNVIRVLFISERDMTLRLIKITTEIISPSRLESMLAIAAPRIPILSKPSSPKIRMGSRMMFVIFTNIPINIAVFVSPIA